MSNTNPGPGWWQASDGRWYPPEQVAGAHGPKKSTNALVIVAAVIGVLLLLGAGGCVAAVVLARDVANEGLEELGQAFDDFEENNAEVVGSDDPGNTGTVEDPLPLGTEVDLANGWRVRVNSADVDADSAVAAADEFNLSPGEGMKFVVVNLTASYDGNDEGTTEFPAIVASTFGSSGSEYNRFDTLATPPDPRFDSAGELLPGDEATGNMVFEVAQDDTDLALKVRPVFSLDSSQAWFSLQ